MTNEQSIPCPKCQTPIPFDTRALISGLSFSCPKCTATIGLTAGSRKTVEISLDELEARKRQLAARKAGVH